MLPVTSSSIERLDDWSVKLSFADRPFLTVYAPWGPVLEVPYWRQSLTYDVYANVYLWYLATLRLCDWADTLSICTEDQDAIWAVLVPVSTWGEATGHPSREFTCSMDHRQCAHELAHCLGQQHLANTGCPNADNPNTGGDAITDAANWGDFDGGRIPEAKAVPFDVIQNSTIIEGVAGGGVWDLMTYCGTRWTTPRRWKLIFDFVGS